MYLLFRWLVMTLAIAITAWLIPGEQVANLWSAIWLAALLGILNAIVRPVLVLLTLPITVLTLGLFIFVINAALVLLAGSIIDGFDPGGFWRALLFSIVLSVVSYLLNQVLISRKERGPEDVIERRVP